MKKYIFITDEGFTFQPDNDDYEPDIENMQVIGFGEGDTVDDAMENMIQENPYLRDTKFNKVIGMEVKSYKQSVLFLKNKFGQFK
ncbi:hypothetical protein ES705_00385 [subsurface metagenome]|uniref:Uncharacterized protein n=1 Tax=marine sediment metagenome TaxID=412755 RepID=X0ZUF6_9ZZZZ|nr:hypothetical protein [Clostridia bacterium]